MADLVFHYRRTLLNGCCEEVFAIHGTQSHKIAETLGPKVGTEKNGLRLVSLHVAECSFGKTHRAGETPRMKVSKSALAAFAGVVDLPDSRHHRPDRREKALRLKLWWQPLVMPAARMPWKDREGMQKMTVEEALR